ncbi:hypothetical protein KKD52_09040 [Myxococcota bacterium]|nr:hypothetical protein [Myxococcota bacterium]MBU1413828.1 hypothetical protein [Myxococcota bacterium]MBU1510492.1 hypothetical protein [Myxococcota bacterium]
MKRPVCFLALLILVLAADPAFGRQPQVPADPPSAAPVPLPADQPTDDGSPLVTVPPPAAAMETRFAVSGREIQAWKGPDMVGTLMLPAAPRRWEVRGRWLIAACGTAGLIVIDVDNPLAMKNISVLEKGKDIVDFRVDGNLLVLVTASYDIGAYRVDLDKDRPLAMSEVLQDPELEKRANGARKTGERIGTVRHVDRGFATIQLEKGVSSGIGDFLEIRSARRDRRYDPVLGKSRSQVSMELLCVARIIQAEGDQVAIRLGRGDDPKVGDFVYFTERPITGSLLMPARYRDQWRAEIEVLPLIGTGEDGDNSVMSMILRGSVHYHSFWPFKVQAGVDPLPILGTSKFETANSAGGNFFVLASYETNSFEIGAGFGYQLPVLDGESPHNRHGGVFLQRMRLGSLDGLNIQFQFQAVYSRDNKDNKRRAMVGMIHTELNVPLMAGVNLFTRFFGDGRTIVHAGLGLRTYLRGNGGPGSFLVPVTLGYTRIAPYYTETTGGVVNNDKQYLVEGTTFSAGLEYRF